MLFPGLLLHPQISPSRSNLITTTHSQPPLQLIMAGRLKDMASKVPTPGPNAANTLGLLLKLGLGGSAVAATGYYSLFNVEAGHRAIIFDRFVGIKPEIIGEGTHFLIPFIQWPVYYDVRTRPRNIMSLTGSKDLQMVNINVRVLSRPEERKLPELYEKLGLDFDDRVLPSIVNEVCKQVVAQYNAVQLLTMREQVSKRIRHTKCD